jgi:microcystin-dependent protein
MTVEPYLGQITLVAFNFATVGWALCNGQLMAIAQNAALFQLLGTTYGGDGQTTFALPDLHGALAFGREGDNKSPAGADWAKPASDTPYGTSSPPGAMSAGSTSTVGGGQPHENRQPYLVINYIIALQGVFPSRN